MRHHHHRSSDNVGDPSMRKRIVTRTLALTVLASIRAIPGRLLGNQIVQSRAGEPPFSPASDPGDGTFDAATEHTLSNSPAPFRSFWQKNGGISVFGRPKSEQFQEVNQADGKTYWVQY